MANLAEAGSNKPPVPTTGGTLTAAALKGSPLLRQIAVMMGIAASVALGVAVVLWSQSPSYTPLYGSLAEKDALQVIEALKQAGADYKVDQSNGMVLVPNTKLQEYACSLPVRGCLTAMV